MKAENCMNPPFNEIEKQDISTLLFGEKKITANDIEKQYPPRTLLQSAKVTRVGPSPTGPMHIGGLYTALISERVAHQTGGIFFLRIEDTDKNREMEGADDLIVRSLTHYGIPYDEGEMVGDEEKGSYGPYKQSNRKLIYKTFVRKLIEEGNAYPCFATEEELLEMRKSQEEAKISPGYYGKWAMWRERSLEDIKKALAAKKPYVIRLKSKGDASKEIIINDVFKGPISQRENNQDIVILKQNGLPTYHFAHVVDDHLMRTTDVFRADEWLSSTALHLQLFEVLGWEPPRYGHLSPIAKKEGNTVRKLSKRKDPEASVEFYDRQGYPAQIVMEYLFNLANSSFESWRTNNPNAPLNDYPFKINELKNRSRSLFDMIKLESMSKDRIATMSAEEVYANFRKWIEENIKDKLIPLGITTEQDEICLKQDFRSWAARLDAQKEYAKAILNIERETEQPRKDISKWSDIPKLISFFYDDIFATVRHEEKTKLLSGINTEDVKAALSYVGVYYDEKCNKDEWLNNMKKYAQDLGYAPDAKTHKANKDIYKGVFADFAKIVRVALTGRTQAPDLYQTMKVMGANRVRNRLEQYLNFLNTKTSN